MNKSYRLIWNAITGCWIAASELARTGRCHSAGRAAMRVALRAMLRSTLAVAGAAAGALAFAQGTPPAPTALPSGGQVVGGQATIAQTVTPQAATMTITQGTQRAALDWTSFDVGAKARVDFVQPSSDAVALNRVQGNSASQIFGRITANGQVFLSNPNGVYFAPGASVDVAGLVATTHRIGLDDFMAGKLRFERQGATGSVINEGELKAALGGYIALLAPEVRNQGVVLARMGTVALAAGEAFELQIDNSRTLAGLRVEASTIRALVDNRSAVLAPGGLVLLSAQAMDRVQAGVIRNSGRIEATGLSKRGGRIVLDASDRVDNTGVVNASATAEGPAGRIEIKAPEVVNAGSIEAKGSAEHPAGGEIQIRAGTLAQWSTGVLDASAPQQGGRIDVRASGQVTLQGRVDASALQVPAVATVSTAAATTAGTMNATPPAAPSTSPEAAVQQGGEIHIQAAAVDLASARLDASGATHGGRITLDASTPANEAPPAPLPAPAPGKLALLGGTQIGANGRRGRGGEVTLLGHDITLDGTTTIDATGALGGGTVLVGGGWQGSGALPQATSVTMGAGARIDASATERGDGGTVVLWSDAHRAGTVTAAHGTLTARGGAQGGDGGRIETSGYVIDHVGIRVDAGSTAGRAGQWLIDPAIANVTQGDANTWATTLRTTDVTNDVSGNITWGPGVTLTKTTGSGATTLTLRSSSGGGITLNGANISSTAGALNLLLWTRYGTSGDAGLIDVQNSSITTNGGSIWMGGGDAGGSWNGLSVGNSLATTWSQGVAALSISNSTLLTGAGSIALKGQAFYSGGGGGTSTGVQVYQGSELRTTTGAIEIDGEVRGTYQYGMGVQIGNVGGATLETTTGNIRINGFGTDTGGPSGWRIATLINSPNGSTTTLRTTTGSITLDGDARFSNHANDSVGLSIGAQGTTRIVSDSGAITLSGSNTANTSQFLNGIRFANGTAAGSIQIGQDAANATDSTSNISVTADSLLQRTNQAGAGSISMRSKGTLTIAPKGTSFTALRADNANTLTFDDDWNFGTKLSGFTLGKSGNTFATTFSNALSVAGPISFYTGQFTLSGSLTSSATGDVWIEAKSVANPGMQISGNISKTGGARSTLTLRSDGRLNIGSAATISGSSTTPLNVVIWSDYINTNTGGVTLAGTFNTFGGHLWAGGSSTANGSATWNGLTVGDGPSSVGFNANSMDFSAAITTAGGNVMLWSGADTMAASSAMSVNAGAGDITIRANKVSWPGTLPITTTGTFTLEPDVVGGSFGQTMSTGWFNLSGATPGGLVIGGSGNTQTISINATQTVNGPITLMGGGITVNNALTSTGTGDITLLSKGDITLNAGIAKTATDASLLKLQANGHITVNGVDLTSSSGRMDTVLISDFNADGVGSIILDGNANANHGVAITTQGGHVWMGGNAGGTANGTTPWKTLAVGTGFAQSNQSGGSGIAGLTFAKTNISTAGGDVSLAGRSWRWDVDRVGVELYQSSIDTGAGSIAIDGRITGGSSGTPQLRPLYIRLSTLTTTTGDITLTGAEGATDSNGNSNGAGLWLGNSTIKTTGSTGGNITLTGTTGVNNGTQWRHGLVMSADGANAAVTVSTVAGNIDITGTSNVTSRADSSGIKLQTSQPTNADSTNPTIKIVSQTGNIAITGDNPANTDTSASATGFTFNGINYGKLFIGYDGTNAYTGNTTLNARSLYVYNTAAGYFQLGGTGALTIASTAASFATGGAAGAVRTTTFDSPYSFGTGHSSITLGKAGSLGGMSINTGITANGPLRIYGGRVDITAPLTVTKSGSALLAQADGLISVATSSGTLQTNGGPLVLWANAADRSSGTAASQIEIQDGVSFKSQGGQIVLAGGKDDGVGSGTSGDGIPDGYAWRGATSPTPIGAVSLGYGGQMGTTGITLESAGGDILIRGSSGGSSPHPGMLSQGKLKIDSGTGAIVIDGRSSTHNGFEFGFGPSDYAITSAKASGTAISLTGTSTATGGTFGAYLYKGLIQATGAAGGIAIVGNSAGTTDALKLTTGMQVLAQGGGISLTANRSTTGSALTLDNAFLGNRKDATALSGVVPSITTSSASITLLANATTYTSAPTVSTTGTLTIAPTSSAFPSAFTWGGSTSAGTFTGTDSVAGLVIKGTGTLGGLTIGKASSAANAGITVKNPIDIGGLVSLYGGSLALNANISSSASASTGSGVLLNTDAISFGAGALVQSPGTLTIQPQLAASSIALGGGSGTLSLASAWFNGAGRTFADGFSAIRIGRTDGTGATTVGGAFTVTDSLVLRNDTGGIKLDGALSTGTNDLTLQTAGSVTQTAAYSTGGLALLGGGTFTLTNAANNAATLAANAASLTVRDVDALAIGTVSGTAGITATGKVDVATHNGNLTLGANITTTNATATAVVLNAGLDAAAGTSTGGDLTVSGTPTITVGTGGFATLYSGSVAGSTGLKTFIGSGSGRFRYNSDEAASNYTLALAAGNNAIFREQPTVTRIVDDKTIVYGGSFSTSLSLGNGQNGDTFAQAFALAPTVTTGGTVSTSGHFTAGTHTLSGSGGSTTSQLGYAVTASINAGTLTVDQRSLTTTWTALDKVYDGSTAATVTRNAGDDRISGDVLNIGTSGASFADRHAGTGKTVTIDGLLLTGADAANYSQASTATTSASITPKALTLSASKTYDGTTTLAAGGIVFGGLVGSETLSVGSATASDAHVATSGKFISAVTLADATDGSGGTAADYKLPATLSAATAPVTISAATLTPTLTNTGVTKVYDGSTTAPAGFAPTWSFTGLASGDTAATLSTTSLAYDSKDVVSATKVSVAGLALAGITGSNGSQPGDYTLAATTSSVAATITPKVLSPITGLAIADKTYDGTTDAIATAWGSVATGVGSETLALSALGASFDSATAGSGKTVTATGYALGNGGNGGLASNYQLASTTATTTANIGKAVLTVSANNDARFVIQAENTAYAGVSLSGFVPGESAADLSGSVTVARTNAATMLAGSYANVLQPDVSGVSSPNYSFTLRSGTYTIVPSNQLLVRVTPVSTTYGGAASYTISKAEYETGGTIHDLSSTGVTAAGSNTFTVSDGAGASATFTVVPDGAVKSGAGQWRVGGYQLGIAGLQMVGGANFNGTVTLVGSHGVTPASLTPDASSGVSKVYDGTTAMVGLTIGLAGRLAGDDVTVGGTGSFASKNAGSGLSYHVSGLALGGADAGNYVLAGGSSFSGSNGSITPRTLSLAYTGVDKVYDGHTTATVTIGDDRIVGDALTLGATAAFADKNVGTGKPVSVSGATLGGADAGNYALASTTGSTTASITRLDSVTWIGGAGGNWFDPANWQGGAVPDLGNVAHVVIPNGITVTFDTSGAVAPADASAPVRIDGLGGAGGALTQHNGTLDIGTGGITLGDLTQNGGTLHSQGGVTLDTFVQNGGSTRTDGNFTVANDFSQGPGGTLSIGGNATITDTTGGLTFGTIDVGGTLGATSTGGDITQQPGTSVVIHGSTTLDAGTNDIVLTNPTNDFGGPFNAIANDITVVDGTGGLVFGNVDVTGNLNAASADGNITQQPGTSIQVDGMTTLGAGASDIVLNTPANDFGGPFNAIGNDITVVDGAGGLVLGAITATGALDASSAVGDLTQAADSAIHVTGTATLSAPDHAVVLRPDGNSFGRLVLPEAPPPTPTPEPTPGPTPEPAPVPTGDSTAMFVPDPAAPDLRLPQRDEAPAVFGEAATDSEAPYVMEVAAFAADSTWIDELTVTAARRVWLGGFDFELPASLREELAQDASVHIRRASGRPLPAWLRFDAARLRFTVASASPRNLPVRVVLTLGSREVSVVLKLAPTVRARARASAAATAAH